MCIRDSLYVPDLDENLICTTKFMAGGYKTIAENGKAKYINPENEVIMEGKLVKNPTKILIELVILPIEEKHACVAASAIEQGNIWHERMGHLNSKAVGKLPRLTVGVPQNIVSLNTLQNCRVCALAKMKKLPHNSVRNRASRKGECIHLDIMGPIEPMGEEDQRWLLAVLDDFSHYVVVYMLRHRDEAGEKIRRFILHIHNLTSTRVVYIGCDNVKEFINADLLEFFGESGIDVDATPPYAYELNGFIERMLQTIGNRIRALIYGSSCPLEWWPQAAEAAAYLLNRSPTDALDNVTPFERWTGRKPCLKYVRKFGSVATVLVPPELTSTLDRQSWFGILVGFSNMGYRIYNLEDRKIHHASNVLIDESKNITSLAPKLSSKSDEWLVIHSESAYQEENIENIIICNMSTY